MKVQVWVQRDKNKGHFGNFGLLAYGKVQSKGFPSSGSNIQLEKSIGNVTGMSLNESNYIFLLAFTVQEWVS